MDDSSESVWDRLNRSNERFPLYIHTELFNFIRYLLFAVFLASVLQLLLDWIVSELRVRDLIKGKQVRLTSKSSWSKPVRAYKTSSIAAVRYWQFILFFILISAGEILIEFGSGSKFGFITLKEDTRLVLKNLTLSERAPDCFDESTCFRYRKVLDQISECSLSIKNKFSSVPTDIEPLNESRKSYKLYCWKEGFLDHINIKKIDMNDAESKDTKDAISMMNGIFYKNVSGILNTIPLSYKSSESRVFHSIEEVNVPGPPGFVGVGYIKETGYNFKMWCDMICAVDKSSHGCNNTRSLERCLLYRSGNESVVITGHALRDGEDFNFFPQFPMITNNFGINNFEHILQHIGTVFWGKDRKRLYFDNDLIRFIMFLRINNHYGFNRVNRTVIVDAKEQEQATIGILFLIGIGIHGFTILTLILFGGYNRMRAKKYKLGWFLGESRFAQHWAASFYNKNNMELNPAENVFVELKAMEDGMTLVPTQEMIE